MSTTEVKKIGIAYIYRNKKDQITPQDAKKEKERIPYDKSLPLDLRQKHEKVQVL